MEEVDGQRSKTFKIVVLSLLFTPLFSSGIFLILFSGSHPFPILILAIIVIVGVILAYIRYFETKMATLHLIHKKDTTDGYDLEIIDH